MTKKTNMRTARPVKEVPAARGSAGHLERVNALLKWWGAPPIDFSANESQLQCLQQFMDGIQALYQDVSSRQRHLLEQASHDISSSAADLAWPRRPREVIGVQAAVAAKLLDGMSRQSRVWTDVAEGFVDCYAVFARGTAEVCHRRTHERDHKTAS